jgi:cysteine desulfurase
VWGGGQERGLRSGTLAVPLIVGLGEALAIACREGRREGERLTAMCAAFVDRIAGSIDRVSFNGHPTERIPGNVSLSIAGVEPLALMHRLNRVASFSASSACSTDKVETSHVLIAMFGDTPRARQAFRVSPGHMTTQAEMALFAEALIDAVSDLRRFAA